MGLNRETDWLRVVLDFLWSSVVVAPLVVVYWRGTWDLLDDMVFPPLQVDYPSSESLPLLLQQSSNSTTLSSNNTDILASNESGTSTTPFPTTTRSPPAPEHQEIQRQMSGLVCYLAGLLVRLLLDLVRFHLGEYLSTKSKPVRLTACWLYTAVYALAGVSFWRGVWFLMKLDVGVDTGHLLVVLLASLAVLVVARVPKSLISSPLAIALDRHEVTFQNGTFFRKTPLDRWWFLVDVIFTNLVIRQLIVFCWWSLWSLENQFLHINFMGEKVSNVVSYDSLILGYSAAVVCLALDHLVDHLTNTGAKLYVIRPAGLAVTLLAFFASVNVWRGIWSMLNHYFLPNIDHDENYIISHITGLAILSILQVANTISNDMVAQDSDTATTINISYWTISGTSSKEGQEEMIPIVE